MVGLGETEEEVIGVLADLQAIGVQIVTIGQYLRPSASHLPVARWWSPEDFALIAEAGRALGHLARRRLAAHQVELPRPAGSRRCRSACRRRGGTGRWRRRKRRRGVPTLRRCGLSAAPFAARLARAHEAMSITGVDALLLSLGADLPWLSGYVAMPLERLTMLVVPAAGSSEQATLVVPALEAPRVTPVPEVFSVRPWGEMEDPVEIVASLVRRCTGKAPALAISDRAWATFLLQLERALPDADLDERLRP